MVDTKKEGLKNGNGDKVAEFKITVTAKDSKGVVLGTGSCPAFSANEEGLAKALKRYTHKGLIELINRQIKTDAQFAAEVKALRNKWGING